MKLLLVLSLVASVALAAESDGCSITNPCDSGYQCIYFRYDGCDPLTGVGCVGTCAPHGPPTWPPAAGGSEEVLLAEGDCTNTAQCDVGFECIYHPSAGCDLFTGVGCVGSCTPHGPPTGPGGDVLLQKSDTCSNTVPCDFGFECVYARGDGCDPLTGIGCVGTCAPHGPPGGPSDGSGQEEVLLEKRATRQWRSQRAAGTKPQLFRRRQFQRSL